MLCFEIVACISVCVQLHMSFGRNEALHVEIQVSLGLDTTVHIQYVFLAVLFSLRYNKGKKQGVDCHLFIRQCYKYPSIKLRGHDLSFLNSTYDNKGVEKRVVE